MFEQILAMGQVLRDQRYQSDELRKLVRERLRAVLISAFEHTAYYRDAMQAAGYDPRLDFSGPEDLAHLPILTKKILKETDVRAFVRESDFEHLDDHFCDLTSGTTGLPLTIYRDRYARALQVAKWLRVLLNNGYRPTQRVLSFAPQTQLSAGRSLIQRAGLLRRQVIGYDLDPERAFEAIRAYRPHILYGLPTGFEFLFDAMEQQRERLEGVKLVVMTGERIHERIRQRCRFFTGVDVTESYGTVEMGVMAYETPNRNGLQLNEDLTYFEFLDDNGDPAAPGQEARIIVTDLSAKLMPFIRYEQGDRVVFSESSMDTGDRRRIQDIIGRDNDYVIMGDGTRRSFIPFYEALDVFTELKRFRIVQVEPDLFDILIVANKEYFDEIKAQVPPRLQRLCGPRPEYRLRLVDEIPRDPSGKIRMLVSNVGRDNNEMIA
jgi:phenylacetate-coenzyme A ligase PaaK-like adenylate-forming protein